MTDDEELDRGPCCCLLKANFDVMAARALSGESALKDDDETAAQVIPVVADAVGEVAETEAAAEAVYGYWGGGGGLNEDVRSAVLRASGLSEAVAWEKRTPPAETNKSSFHAPFEHAVIATMLNSQLFGIPRTQTSRALKNRKDELENN